MKIVDTVDKKAYINCNVYYYTSIHYPDLCTLTFHLTS